MSAQKDNLMRAFSETSQSYSWSVLDMVAYTLIVFNKVGPREALEQAERMLLASLKNGGTE